MKTQEIAPVACPQCQTRYNAPVISILNVGENPALKTSLLQKTLNAGQCPQCGFTAPANIPLLYFDNQKELALALVPHSLGLSHTDEQKLIGSLTNRLINTLPPEQRKGYLLNPKTFLTLDSLIKAVLAADGITEDVIQAQTAKLQLLDTLLKANNDAEFNTLVKKHEPELDFQFFEILTAIAVQALQEEDHAKGQTLFTFRQLLAESVNQGLEFVAQIDEKIGLKTLSPEKLLADLQQATGDDEFMALVSAGKAMLDYTFFQNLTGKIEAVEAAGNTAEAKTLKTLRTRILDASARIDEETRKMLTQASQLLQTLLKAANPRQAVLENLEQIDDALLSILAANIQEAEKTGKQAAAEKLITLYNIIIETMQEQMPPEMHFLDELMSAPSPAALQSILAQNRGLVTPEFIGLVTQLQADFQSRGQSNLAAKLGEIKRQAETMPPG